GLQGFDKKGRAVGRAPVIWRQRGRRVGKGDWCQNRRAPRGPPCSPASAKLRSPGSAFFGKIAEGHAAGSATGILLRNPCRGDLRSAGQPPRLELALIVGAWQTTR